MAKPARNVQRYDHHHFHGWVVTLKRAGTRHVRYFHDRGDPQAAFARATRFRDDLAAQLPPPTKFKRRLRTSRTGIVGVARCVERTRAGRRVARYSASWYDEHGRPRKRSFSVLKYGEEAARHQAVQARQAAIARLLRPQREP